MKKVYLIDAFSYIFRAFYAVAPLTNKEGLPVNALFGFTKMIIKLLNETKAENISLIFDAGKETFRKEIYSEYKANRTAAPEELIAQFPYFKDVADVFGIPYFELVGYEADDIIATLATRLKTNYEVIIISGDKDLCQLVDDRVTILDTMKDLKLDIAGVVNKLGVKPEYVADFLALMGDSSDNIPGVPGIGNKTAVELVNQYGDVDNIVKNLDNIAVNKSIRSCQKISNSIKDNLEILRISKELTTAVTNLELPFDTDTLRTADEIFEILKIQEVEPDKWEQFTQKFGFSSLKKVRVNLKSEKQEVKLILENNFEEFLNQLRLVDHFGFDTETDSLNAIETNLIGASFAFNSNAFYIPFNTQDSVKIDNFKNEIKQIFNSNKLIIGHNLKFDLQVLTTIGVEVSNNIFDTYIASYLLNPDQSGQSLKNLAEELLGINPITFEQVTGGKNFKDVDVNLAAEYAGADAINTLNIYYILNNKLKSENLLEVFNLIEMPLIFVLVEMERSGIKIDLDFLSNFSNELNNEIELIRSQIHESAGEEFNLNSTKKLSEILFDKLKLSTQGIKKTTLGYSTDSNVLEKISDLHTLPKLILDYRMYYKLKSTYVDSIPALADSIGRVHTSFNQAITATGRLSSSNPNLQNIPIATKMGRRVRNAFIAESGYTIVSADYSQIELRLLAHMSGDDNLTYAFKNNLDIHSQTAREILDLPALFEISSEQRRIGKTINFGIVYGMGANKLAKELGISFNAANKYISDYFQKYPKVRNFFDRLSSQGMKDGFVTTISGRKRYLIPSDNNRDPGFLKRIAINSPIQGSAADLIKLAMIKISKIVKEYDARLLLQIHDELVFEVKDLNVEKFKNVIKDCMENVYNLDVPLKVDINSGKNWNEAH